jgi:hypothetical protein
MKLARRLSPVVVSALLLMVPMLLMDTGAAEAAGGAAKKPAAGAKTGTGGKRVVKTGGDSRAWATIRQVLPADALVVGQVNVAAIRATETFKQVRKIAEKDRDLKEGVALVKTGCKIDLVDAIGDVAFAATDSNDDHMLVAVSWKGLGEAELKSCAELLIGQKRGKAASIEVKRSGGISEYRVPGESDVFYAAWLASDVIAFAGDTQDRALLEKLIGGKGGFDTAPQVRRALAAVPPGAVAWGAYLKEEQLDSYTMKLGVASMSLVGGQLSIDVSLFMADADGAKRAAAEWIAQRDQMVNGANGVPPMVATLVKAVQIAANGEVVHVTASLSEKDLLGFLSLF